MAASSSLPPMLVCLDFDGCLVDSHAAITTAISHTLRARGLAAPPQEDLERCIGPPLIECFGRLLAGDGANIEEARRCVEDYREVYPALAAELTTVVDGMPRALEALSADVTLAVVTSKPGAYTRPLLYALDLGRFFSGTFAPPLSALDEAKATTLSRALAWFAPQAAIMVGDRWHDIIAGRVCGARTIGVTWGIGSAGELRDVGADVLIDDPGDLAETVVSCGAALGVRDRHGRGRSAVAPCVAPGIEVRTIGRSRRVVTRRQPGAADRVGFSIGPPPRDHYGPRHERT